MKTFYIIIAFAFVTAFSSCTKECYKCTVSITDINGTEIGKKTEKHCVDKDNETLTDYYDRNPDCKPTI